MALAQNDPRIGARVQVAPPEHVGHTLQVIGISEQWPSAFVLECECGGRTLVGSHYIDRVLAGDAYQLYGHTDEAMSRGEDRFATQAETRVVTDA